MLHKVYSLAPLVMLLSLRALAAPSPSPFQLAADTPKINHGESRAPRLVPELGHTNDVEDIDCSLDGQFVASASSDGTARLWELSTGRELRTFAHPLQTSATSVCVSKHGQYLLSGGSDGVARLWQGSDGRQLMTFRHEKVFIRGQRQIGAYISAVTLSVDARFVLTGGWDGARLWNAETGELVFELTSLRVETVAYSPDGRLIAAATEDGNVFVWTAKDGQEHYILTGHKGHVLSLSFSKDSNTLLSSGLYDRSVRLWDLGNGQELARQRLTLENDIWGAEFSPDERSVVIASRDQPVIIWDLNEHQETLRIERSSGADTLAVAADGTVISEGNDHVIRRWEVQTGQQTGQFGSSPTLITFSAFSGDDRFVVVGDADRSRMSVWDLKAGRQILQFSNTRADPELAAFSEDGSSIVMLPHNGGLNIRELPSGNTVSPLTGSGLIAEAVEFVTDEEFVVASSDGLLRFFHVTKGHVQTSQLPFSDILTLHRAADESLLLAGRHEGGAHIIDAAKGNVTTSLSADHVIDCVALSKSGQIAIGSGGSSSGLQATVWDVDTTEALQTIGGLSSEQVAISRDGHFACIGTELWDLKVCKRLVSLNLPAEVQAIQFSEDARHLTTVSVDGSVCVWDIPSGELLNTERQARLAADIVVAAKDLIISTSNNTLCVWNPAAAHVPLVREIELDDFITQVAVSPSGKYVVTLGPAQLTVVEAKSGKIVSQTGGPLQEIECVAISNANDLVATGIGNSVHLWKKTTGEHAGRLAGHTEAVSSIRFMPGGRSLLTAGSDGTVRVWNLKTQEPVLKLPKTGTPSFLSFSVVECSQDGELIAAAGGIDWDVQVWQRNGDPVCTAVNDDTVKSIGFSSDGRFLMAGGLDSGYLGVQPRSGAGLFDLTSVVAGKAPMRDKVRGQNAYVYAICVAKDSPWMMTGNADGATDLWDISGKPYPICRLIPLDEGSWVAVSPDGRFDSNDPDAVQGVHWVFDDDPFRTLPPEIFMRDYYEPELLSRLLKGEEFGEVRSLVELNRIQPKIYKPSLAETDERGLVEVSVKVAGPAEVTGSDAKNGTGVYDLRLFRDGQLVGQWPDYSPDAALPTIATDDARREWRKATTVCGKGESVTRTFTVRLPRNLAGEDVEFSAYAFNEDRVKSETKRIPFRIPDDLEEVEARAFVVTVGVNAYESPAWDLEFAANDAHRLQEVFGKHLPDYKVVPTSLISEYGEGGKRLKVNTATKDNVRNVFKLLAGDHVGTAARKLLPPELRTATPDDLVLLFFSGHGYTHADGTFYFFPHDIGRNRPRDKLPDDLLQQCISSIELSDWLRNIDAGEMVMIIDSCHSAGAVETDDVKLGPFGSRGLGQLAYDKGMRVLVASQSEEVALETSELEQGLLTHALVHDGLEQRWAEEDGVLTVKKWLEYAVSRVPLLYDGVLTGEFRNAQPIDIEGLKTRPPIQQPSLFDFNRTSRRIVLRSPTAD